MHANATRSECCSLRKGQSSGVAEGFGVRPGRLEGVGGEGLGVWGQERGRKTDR